MPLTWGPQSLQHDRIFHASMHNPLKSSGAAISAIQLSRDLMRSTPKSPVGTTRIVDAARRLTPPEAQDHRNTTFPGQGKSCRRTLGGGLLLNGEYTEKST